MSKEFGKRLKALRESSQLKTQAALAKAADLAEVTIRQYESGKYEPKHENMKKIAAALGVSLSDLAPDQYPVSFDTPEDYETAWIEKGGAPHPGRNGDIGRIRVNEKKLDDDGINELANYSDYLVSSGKYEKK